MSETKWISIIEAENDIEANIISSCLNSSGIPVKLVDGDPYSGAMRVIGGLANNITIMVPEEYYNKATEVIKTAKCNDDYEGN